MTSVQHATLRKAAVWLATLLVVLQSVWIMTGCVLSLTDFETHLFPPSWRGLSTASMLAVLSAVAFAIGLQTLAVWRQSRLCSIVVGSSVLAMAALAGIGFLFTLLFVFAFEFIPLKDVIPSLLSTAFLIVSWLYIGIVMLMHAVAIRRRGFAALRDFR